MGGKQVGKGGRARCPAEGFDTIGRVQEWKQHGSIEGAREVRLVAWTTSVV